MRTKSILKALNEGFEHTLPSGVTVKMRRISLESYKRKGILPTHLQSITLSVHAKGFPQVAQDSPADMAAFFEWVCCEALLDPKTAVAPEDDSAIPLDYFTEQDKLEIFRLAFLDISKAVERLRPLSSRGTARGCSSLMSSDSDTAADQAD